MRILLRSGNGDCDFPQSPVNILTYAHRTEAAAAFCGARDLRGVRSRLGGSVCRSSVVALAMLFSLRIRADCHVGSVAILCCEPYRPQRDTSDRESSGAADFSQVAGMPPQVGTWIG